MWAISPDKADGLSAMGKKSELGFPLLIDEGSEAIKAWGVLNEKQGSVPHPTVAVVDTEGTVQFFHLDEDYTRRPSPSVIVDALEGLGGS